MSGGALTKLYGALLFMIPILVIIFYYKPNRSWLRQLIWIYGLAGLMLWPILLDQQALFGVMTNKLGNNAVTGNDLLIWENIKLSMSWFLTYLTPIGFGLACIASLSLLFIRQRIFLVLLIIIGTWWGALAIISNVWYPRYLVPIVPLILLLITIQADGLAQYLKTRFNWQRSEVLQFGIICLITIAGFNFNRLLLTDPVQAAFPDIDRSQYVESEWAI